MALILSLETSTPVCSVALHQEGTCLASMDLYMKQSHSGRLSPMIEQVLKISNFSMQDLQAIALAKGPGSYTGLRIGTSTAKGLAYALNIPLLAINTLEAMADQALRVSPGYALYCPMLDARRMEVYCTLIDTEGQVFMPTKAKIIDETSFAEELLSNRILFFGDGAPKCREVLGASPQAFFLEAFPPTAQAVGRLAYPKFLDQAWEDVAYFEPFYLKDFVATIPKNKFLKR